MSPKFRPVSTTGEAGALVEESGCAAAWCRAGCIYDNLGNRTVIHRTVIVDNTKQAATFAQAPQNDALTRAWYCR